MNLVFTQPLKPRRHVQALQGAQVVLTFLQGFSSPFFSTQTMERLLSNTLTTSTSKQNYKSLAEIQSTASSSQLIDVLISNVWPSTITHFSTAPLPTPELSSIGVPPLDDTIRRTKPRYHFAASGGQPPMFWEREPFTWNDEDGRVSRFVSLGAFGGEPTPGKKQRVRASPIRKKSDTF